MTVLTSQASFTVQDPLQTLADQVDLVLLPANSGSGAMRELHYPNDTLPPLIYQEPPDYWENFDSGPLTSWPLVKGELTLEDVSLASWPGYLKDQPVREIWAGTDTKSRMPADMLRRLLEYWLNPPDPATQGYITWIPKDRTSQAYNIIIEQVGVVGLSIQGDPSARRVSNLNALAFHNLALAQGYIMGQVSFTFTIVSEAT